MSFNLQAYGRFDARIDGAPVNAGSVEKPYPLSVTGKKYELGVTVNANANATIYNDQLSGFGFLWIQSTRDIRIALTSTGTNTVTMSLDVMGSADYTEYGGHFILFSDDTRDADGVAARIASIIAYNDDTTSGNNANILIKVIS